MLLLMSDSESVASSSTLFSTFIFSFQFEKSVLVPKKNVKILKKKKKKKKMGVLKYTKPTAVKRQYFFV